MIQQKKKKSSKRRATSGQEEAAAQPSNINQEIRFTQSVVKKGLRNVASHHIESFDYAMQKCLPRICTYMLPVEVLGGSDTPSIATPG